MRSHVRPVLIAALVLGLLAPAARAEVDRLEITHREVVAGGRAFGLAGPYEKLAGTVHLSLDPEAPGNAAVVDLDRAPRGEDGRVHLTADFTLLGPVEPFRGNGTLLLEVPNRGGKAAVFYFNRGARRTYEPSAPEDFGDGFLMRQGFTVGWLGWQFDVPAREELLRLETVPVEGGEGVEGLVRSDHVFPEPAELLPLGHRDHRPYPVADPADPRNVLTVRDGRLGERRPIPRQRWDFVATEEGGDLDAVRLEGGFAKGRIYELVYVSREPVVVGAGLAALRDFVSYLKHAEASPVPVDHALALGISQTGRFLRHFLYQGFNADLEGRPAFDGVLAHTAGAGRGSFNHRYGQPSRDAHPFSAFFYPTDIFPFTGTTQHDPVSGLTDGLLRRLEGTPARPKLFLTNTGYEYWGRAAGLVHTTVDGDDLAPRPNTRIYHLASTQHFVDRFPPQRSATRHLANPANFLFTLRALLVGLEAWVADGVEPPPSRYPTLAEGTLVAPAELAFPEIPGVRVPETPHQAYRMDYGPRFRTEGVVSRQPPAVGEPFPSRVPQVDADGNELGGVRLPEIAVPLATYTPWNFRAASIGAPDELADFRGSFLALPTTAAERRRSGDPRPSVEARYGSFEAYLGRYTAAAVELVEQRYLLAEDLPEMIAHARELWELVVERGGEGRKPAP